jgi:hypothetical protein
MVYYLLKELLISKNMINFSPLLQNSFLAFDNVFYDYFRFWLAFALYLILFFALFDLYFRQ